MKPTHVRLAAGLAVLSLFGFGCVPQVVRVPPAPPEQATPTQTQDAVDTTKPLAYVELNGGAATVTRGGSTVAVQDDTQLVAGDEVRVSSGTTSLVYPGAGESQLDAGADVTLIADGPDTGDVFTELQVSTGEVWTRFERLLGANEHFSVEANGVVATVRGTGFGVDADGDNTDVQVAEHYVDVTSEADEAAATPDAPVQAVHLVAGQGFKVSGTQLRQLGLARLRANVRMLTALEKARKEFLFGSTAIPLDRLNAPLHPVLLQLKASAIAPALEKRIEVLKQREAVEAQLKGFAAPTRTLQSGETAPEGAAPTSTGPASLELDSQETFTVK